VIRAGVDNTRIAPVGQTLALGELMARFLSHKYRQSASGDLAKPTLAGYLREVSWFVEFMKPQTPVAGVVTTLGRPRRKMVLSAGT